MNRNTPHTLINKPTLATTLQAMKVAAHKGKKDLTIRRLVEKICSGISQGDYNSEILAIYYWVCANIRYIRDIKDIEFLKEPYRLLETQAGDCDDLATLLAAMLMACGNKVRFAVVGLDGNDISHVYCEVFVKGKWITVDPVAAQETNKMHQRITVIKYWEV